MQPEPITVNLNIGFDSNSHFPSALKMSSLFCSFFLLISVTPTVLFILASILMPWTQPLLRALERLVRNIISLYSIAKNKFLLDGISFAVSLNIANCDVNTWHTIVHVRVDCRSKLE